ncbi:unnamed protein product [Bemisia tabaci]|uniref:Double jelly roll-like domain-containing protein n=1 Tax=Bemisia tabaci TaxID=7038 RepID=A0A9P0EZN1_BEMTA|nr:unnamed protein product [Bemisia tabaci]
MLKFVLCLVVHSIPCENLNEDFDNDMFAFYHENYINFMTDFSQEEKLCGPPLSKKKFKEENPMFVMRCLCKDVLKLGPLDIQIDLEAHENIPQGTFAYAIHNVTFSYQSLSGTVKKSTDFSCL